ncbi:MAG: DUF512 domain-containing protein [Lachnospiraceae bacterium]|nr:DUF512 domain-containing protein [Lachnospiraceae bacterium]
MKNRGFEHLIKTVIPGSIAEEMEIEPGDILVSIGGQKIRDVFDYRFYVKDEYLEVLIRKPDGEEWELEIEKDEDEDLGLEFENDLMSEYKSCSNKCIFCFIDQMPPGMRETLYFKDDDSRLSFLPGNYITLTNMTDEDVDRIIYMQLAPINISVHTTDPELRCKMLHNRFAGEKLRFIDRLYEGHVEMNGQVVLCKGYNDGENLDRTIRDLTKYLPFMHSVSVVPAGITKYREGLCPLEMFTKEEAGRVIDQIESYQQGLFEKWGLHFIHASDEWYILAERDFPEEDRYDGYLQLENGVGMMRLLITEFEEELARRIASGDGLQKEAGNAADISLPADEDADLTNQDRNAADAAYDHQINTEARAGQEKTDPKENDRRKDANSEENRGTGKRIVSLVTGKLPYPTIRGFAEKIEKSFPRLTVKVHCIRNDFFGETITVTGLITGGDLIKQLAEKKESGEDLGEVLLIPSNMLRSGEEVFLDDVTISDVEERLGIQVGVIGSEGADLLRSIVDGDYELRRHNDADSFVYTKNYAKGK